MTKCNIEQFWKLQDILKSKIKIMLNKAATIFSHANEGCCESSRG